MKRLIRGGHQVAVYNRSPGPVKELAAEGAIGTSSLKELAGALEPPRVVWVMVPAGAVTEQIMTAMAELLAAGDVLIDGGNSHYKDDVRRARALQASGIHYIDVGTSGGVWGLERGYCQMIGGDAPTVERLRPIFATLAPGRGNGARTAGRGPGGTAEEGFLHCGAPGAGHFVKMIHNGIEYGLMQAYAEGFDILKNADSDMLPPDQRLELNLADAAEVWRRGSVISSWLLDLAAAGLAQDGELSGFTGYVQDSGEGRWTLLAAIEEAVPAEVLSAALHVRFRSRQGEHTFAEKLLSAMRKGFGGHLEPEHGG
jgi:6-phosphogluconate dehydrogenase